MIAGTDCVSLLLARLYSVAVFVDASKLKLVCVFMSITVKSHL